MIGLRSIFIKPALWDFALFILLMKYRKNTPYLKT